MTVHVVIVKKDGCTPNAYVYEKREDATKLYNYYNNMGVNVALEEAEVREKYGD